MCGIIATITSRKNGFSNDEREQFKSMLVLNSLRGRDSTGLFGTDYFDQREDSVATVKVVGSPYVLFEWEKTEQFFKGMLLDYNVVVGHSRYATQGDVTAENAHPFTEGNVTLVHNGVIKNYHALKNHKEDSDIEVDSHLIARLIDKEGAEAVLPHVRGAFVFVWWDNKEKALKIAKNKERPLYMVRYNKHPTWQFASEFNTLEWNRGRNGADVGQIIAVPDFQILTFRKDVDDPEIVEFKEKTYVLPPKQEEDKKLPVILTPEKGGDKKNLKFRGTDKTEPEFFVYENTERPHSIKIGDFVTYDIMDYKSTESGEAKLIFGASATIPNVEFMSVGSVNANDHNLTVADHIRGSVSRIYPINTEESFYGQPWRVVVSDAYLVMKGRGGDVYVPLSKYNQHRENDTVSIVSTTGEQVNIPKENMVSMMHKGCAWCQSEFDEKDVTNLGNNVHNMMLWEDKDDLGVVCPSCTESYTKTVIEGN